MELVGFKDGDTHPLKENALFPPRWRLVGEGRGHPGQVRRSEPSLNHLIRSQSERRGDGQAEWMRGPQVDQQLEVRWLLDR